MAARSRGSGAGDPPLIGISAATEKIRWRDWEAEVAMVTRNCLDAVVRGGGVPLMIPPFDGFEDSVGRIIGLLDGVMIAGGTDVDPRSFGGRDHPAIESTTPERDRAEIALVRVAAEQDLAVLGICRGMQIVNIALGGTLEPHLPDVLGHNDHAAANGAFAEHEVAVEAGSLAARSTGREREPVKSAHHQAVGRLGDDLLVSGRAVPDEIVEAIELPGRGFVLGVLWHPEQDPDSRVIGSFVEAAGQMRRER